jgi:hypothetical protein
MRTRELKRLRRDVAAGIEAVAWLKKNRRKLGFTLRESLGFEQHLHGLMQRKIDWIFDDQMPSGTCYAFNLEHFSHPEKIHFAQRAFYGLPSLFPVLDPAAGLDGLLPTPTTTGSIGGRDRSRDHWPNYRRWTKRDRRLARRIFVDHDGRRYRWRGGKKGFWMLVAMRGRR